MTDSSNRGKTFFLSAIIFTALGFGIGYLVFGVILVPRIDNEHPGDLLVPVFDDEDLFVSTKGVDSPEGGGIDNPFLTISYALSQAELKSAVRINVERGVYMDSVSLVDGVSILGGFSEGFKYYSLELFRATLKSDSLNRSCIYGEKITTLTIIGGLIIYGPQINTTGTNAYTIFLLNCNSNLSIRNCEIWGGSAGDGDDGDFGTDGSNGGPGSMGASAQDYNAGDPIVLGGSGGAGAAAGGNGGSAGGSLNPPSYDSQSSAQAGSSGQPSSGATAGSGGSAGYDSEFISDFSIAIPSSGSKDGSNGGVGGDGTNGGYGAGGQQDSFSFVNQQWKGADGLTGGNGGNGAGGGGGGAGGGIEANGFNGGTSVLGPTGGGGGAGGQGGSGGGCFCIYVYFTTPTTNVPQIYNNSIYLGRSGDGGLGGHGGTGGTGGSGGLGGTNSSGWPYSVTGSAGMGGKGGDGGHGGGGGGGSGGWSIGIFAYKGNSTSYYSLNDLFKSFGRAGKAGIGGMSIGSSGTSGEAGLLNETYFTF